MKEKIVVIGAGIAAISGIKAIRELNTEAEIALFSDEPVYPYNRMKLSKSLFDTMDQATNLLQRKEWYEQNHVKLHLGEVVQQINPNAQTVTLTTGKQQEFDKLLITNGAKNRVPELKKSIGTKLHTLRKMEDAQKIHQKLNDIEKVINIGGGIQGLETAWILHQQRKKVIVAEIQKRLMSLQLDEKGSRILQNLAEQFGIEVLTNTRVIEIKDDNGNSVAITENGKTIPYDMILYSVGITPNLEIVNGTSIQTNRGILVNDHMQTSVENIYAAGDVAEFNGKVFGLWNVAVEQGKIAGYNMMNQTAIYHPVVPVTTLNGFGITLFSMGDITGNFATNSIVNEDNVQNTYMRIFINNDRIIGAIMIGDTSKSPLLKSAIEKPICIENVDWSKTTTSELLEYLKNLKTSKEYKNESCSVL